MLLNVCSAVPILMDEENRIAKRGDIPVSGVIRSQVKPQGLTPVWAAQSSATVVFWAL